MEEEFYRGQRIKVTTNTGRVIRGRFKGSLGSNRILLADGREVEKDKSAEIESL